MDFSALPGVFDIIPFDPKDIWKSSALWEYVEEIMRKHAQSYNFREIRTPVFEKTELFTRGVGEGTDIVSKEMYTFLDKGDRSITLRPEGTASCVRAFIENRLEQSPTSNKFYYIGSFYRYERMQAGRFREFRQFGVEAYGNGTPEQDVEIIDLAFSLYRKLGIRGLNVQLNSIGSGISRANYREALLKHLGRMRSSLSAESQARMDKNPLRVLDSKDPQDIEAVKTAPSILDFLSPEDKLHFVKVQEGLTDLQIPFIINTNLVRGLDYYNKTVFEIVSSDLGAQSSLCGGGRYDGLVKSLGGNDLPSTGFATGIERVLQVMLKQNLLPPAQVGPILYLIPMGEKGKKVAQQLAHVLRQENISVEVDLDDRKVGKAFAKADNMKAHFAAVVGDNEVEKETLELKKLSNQEKSSLHFSSLPRVLKLESEGKKLVEKYLLLTTPFSSEQESKFFLDQIQSDITSMSDATLKLEEAIKSFQKSLNPPKN